MHQALKIRLSRCGIVPHIVLVLLVWMIGAIAVTSTAQGAHPFAIEQQRLPALSNAWLQQWLGQVAIWQADFYKQLTGAVHAWKSDSRHAWWLLWLSFAYGVLHAIGPGHGKAVLSAYVLANRETVRNGAILAVLSAIAQALVAITIVSIAAGVLNLTGMQINQIAGILEIAAYAAVTLLGAWLVYRHVLTPVLSRLSGRASEVTRSHHHHHHGQCHDHRHAGCGHHHMPTPDQVSGKLNIRKALGVIAAVGLRPCTGAILVLVFALSQQIFVAGIAAALAMGLGTGLTVGLLAISSVTVGRAAESTGHFVRASVASSIGATLQGLAAIVVLVLGLFLLTAAWQFGVW